MRAGAKWNALISFSGFSPPEKKKPLSICARERRFVTFAPRRFGELRLQEFFWGGLVQSIPFMLVGQFQLSVNEKELRYHLAGRDSV